jgi:UDP-N-acetylglucosamine:LPS N-acetylglucosamine transferase
LRDDPAELAGMRLAARARARPTAAADIARSILQQLGAPSIGIG